MSRNATQGLVFTDRASGARRARSREVTRIRRGVGADAEWWSGIAPWERYRLRVTAAALALRHPVLALESAAVLHGLPVFGEPADIHVLASPGSRGYRDGDVIRHMRRTGVVTATVDGIEVTSLEDTVLDLIRVLPLAFAVAVVDAARRRGTAVDDLRATLATQADRRGRRRANRALDLSDARSESVLESVSRVVMGLLGYEEPELQAEFLIASGRIRTDFFWRGAGVVGEADGRSKYFTGEIPTVDAVHAERRREIELRRVVRDIARWEWADAVNPARLDEILHAASLRRIRPRDPGLETAVDNLRSLRPPHLLAGVSRGPGVESRSRQP